MAKQYGVTCDRCDKSITSPTEHTTVKVIEPYNTITRYDLCLNCSQDIRFLFSQHTKELPNGTQSN